MTVTVSCGHCGHTTSSDDGDLIVWNHDPGDRTIAMPRLMAPDVRPIDTLLLVLLLINVVLSLVILL